MFGKRKPITIGLQDWQRDICQAPAGYPFTPDLWRLEKYQMQLIFVYDEWMSDRHQSFVVKDEGELVGRAFTKDRWNFLIKSTDPNKTAFALQDDQYGHRIMGEVFIILPDLFIKLDKLKLNGLQSLRDRVQILFPYHEHGFVKNSPDGYFTEDGLLLPEALQGRKHWIGPEKVYILECHMYYGHPSYWKDMVHQQPFLFERVKTFQPKKDKAWLEEYYRYQNPDI